MKNDDLKNRVSEVQKTESKLVRKDIVRVGRPDELDYPFIKGVQLYVCQGSFRLGDELAAETLKRMEQKLAR